MVLTDQVRSGMVCAAIATIALCIDCVTPATADPLNLVENADFSGYSGVTYSGQTYLNAEVTNSNMPGWQVTGCWSNCGSNAGNQLMFNYNASLTGVFDANDGGIQLNMPGNGPGASPAGGNAITADADYENGAIYQNITGLKAGDTYTLSFYQATTDLIGYNQGAFQASWEVGFGGQTAYGSTMLNPGATSTGWVEDTMSFTADAASEVLGFLATSPQSGEPPFLLLSGVSLTDSTPVPEPASLALLGAGILGLVAIRRRRA